MPQKSNERKLQHDKAITINRYVLLLVRAILSQKKITKCRVEEAKIISYYVILQAFYKYN